MSSASSPLLDMAITYVNECEKKVSPDQIPLIRDVFERFISGRISYQECTSQLTPIIGTTQPIDKIDVILRTPDQPLPTMPMKHFDVAINQMRAKTRPWTTYEDQRLLAGLHRFGFDDWAMISQFVGNGRTKAQCSQRWARGLDPKINKDQWSEEQDSKLLQLVHLFGDKSWTKIASKMGNRCDVQCRYRYKQLNKEANFQEKMNKAAEEAKINGEELSAETKTTKTPRPRQPKHHNQPQLNQTPYPMNFQQNMMYYQQLQMPLMQPMANKMYMQQNLMPQNPMQQQIMMPQHMTNPMGQPMPNQMMNQMPNQMMNRMPNQMNQMQSQMNNPMANQMNNQMQNQMPQQIPPVQTPQNMQSRMGPQISQNQQNSVQIQTPQAQKNMVQPMPSPQNSSMIQNKSPMIQNQSPMIQQPAQPIQPLQSEIQPPQPSEPIQISMQPSIPNISQQSSQIRAQPSFQFDEISASGSLVDWQIKNSPSGTGPFGISQNGSYMW